MEEEKKRTFIELVSEVQSNLVAPKSQYNSFGKYSYRNAEDILKAVKPLLAERGLVLVLVDDVELIGERYYLKATATVTDGEKNMSAVAYAREPVSRKGMDDSQITGTASSYARKYALNGLFAIDDTKDADSMEAPSGSGQARDRNQSIPVLHPEVEEALRDAQKTLVDELGASKAREAYHAMIKLLGVESSAELTVGHLAGLPNALTEALEVDSGS